MVNYRHEIINRDAAVDLGEFGIAAAPNVWRQLIPYAGIIWNAARRNKFIATLDAKDPSLKRSDPWFAQRVVDESGFGGLTDVVRWSEARRKLYGAWQKAKGRAVQEIGPDTPEKRAWAIFNSMAEPANDVFYLARKIAGRRMAAHGQIAHLHRWGKIESASDSFLDTQAPGLRASVLDSIVDSAAPQIRDAHPVLKQRQADSDIFRTIPREALDGITPDEKMRLAQAHAAAIPETSRVKIKRVENALCLGFKRNVMIGLNPAESFFVFLAAMEHELRHVEWRSGMVFNITCAAMDELSPHISGYFKPPSIEDAENTIHILKEVLGPDRVPESLKPEHIVAGLQSLQDEDNGHYTPYPVYVLDKAVQRRVQARVLDENIDAEELPYIMAEEHLRLLGRKLSIAEAIRKSLEPFQIWLTMGRPGAYEAAFWGAAMAAEKMTADTAARRIWTKQNINRAGRNTRFPDFIEKICDESLSEKAALRHMNAMLEQPHGVILG